MGLRALRAHERALLRLAPLVVEEIFRASVR